jgi:hypothetical protein
LQIVVLVYVNWQVFQAFKIFIMGIKRTIPKTAVRT